ncbi:hypothetical protein BOX15_Mlig008304g2, partial [Macrostomum lignano]
SGVLFRLLSICKTWRWQHYLTAEGETRVHVSELRMYGQPRQQLASLNQRRSGRYQYRNSLIPAGAATAASAEDETPAPNLSELLRRRRQSSVQSRRLLLARRRDSAAPAGFGPIEESQLSEEELERRQRRIAHLRFRLRFFLKLVVTAYKLCDKHYLTCQRLGSAFNSQQESIARTDGANVSESGAGGGGLAGVYFDRSEFRANRQMRLPAEARRILRKRWDDRSEAEVNYTVIALRSVQQIADYPVRMQRNLARHGMLESFNPGRIIVRQSDPAQAFYFILFGTVMVAVLDAAAEAAQTVVELQRGDSFGELAIMNRSRRQSTVISRTDCDLLSIGVDAYEATFMQGGQKTLTDPDHNQFIESLDFLRGWPKEYLQLQHDKFLFCYFKRSSVMIKNSSKSKWIYILKSGSARVLLVLNRVTSQVTGQSGALQSSATASSLQRHRLLAAGDQEDADSDVTSSVWLDAFYDSSGVYSPAGIGANSAPYPRRRLSTSGTSSAAEDSEPATMMSMSTPPEAPTVLLPQRPLTSLPTDRLSRNRQTLPAYRQATPSNRTSAQSRADSAIGSADSSKTTSGKNGGVKMGRKTFYDDLDAGQVELTHQPEFVHMQTLTRGAVFGLQDLFKPDQPSLCVVSNGAECLLLDKAFFLEHSPRQLLDRLRNRVTHYPSRAQLQTRLQERVNWEAYKQLLVRGAVRRQSDGGKR